MGNLVDPLTQGEPPGRNPRGFFMRFLHQILHGPKKSSKINAKQNISMDYKSKRSASRNSLVFQGFRDFC